MHYCNEIKFIFSFSPKSSTKEAEVVNKCRNKVITNSHLIPARHSLFLKVAVAPAVVQNFKNYKTLNSVESAQILQLQLEKQTLTNEVSKLKLKVKYLATEKTEFKNNL